MSHLWWKSILSDSDTKQLNCQLENIHINTFYSICLTHRAKCSASQMPNQMHQSISFRLWKHTEINNKTAQLPYFYMARARTMSIIWIGLWHLECGIADFIQWTKHNSNRCAQMCAASLSLSISVRFCFYLFSNKKKVFLVFYFASISNARKQLVSFEKC